VLRLLRAPESLISRVTDRPGHDRRYAVDATKVRALGWRPGWTFDAALAATVEWYRANRWWWEPLRAGSARVVARDLETPDAD